MAKYVRNTTDNTVTESGEDTFFGNMIDGISAVFMGPNDLIGRVPARWNFVVGAVAGGIPSGMIARRRAEAGKPAIGGFLL